MDIGISIGKYKKENNLPTIDYDRRDYILSKYSNALSEYGVQVFNLIHNVSVKIQQDETYYNDIRGYKKIK
jgi:chorismate mutase